MIEEACPHGAKEKECPVGDCWNYEYGNHHDYKPPETVQETAERMWPGVSYDTALPQPWVNVILSQEYWNCAEKGFDPRGKFVWGYPDKCIFGVPLPLTAEAADTCCQPLPLTVPLLP